MNYRLLYLINFAILFNTLNVSAQNLHEEILTLESAIAEAMANNPLLRAYQEEAISRKANIEPQAALEDPSLDLEFQDYPVSSLSPRTSDAGEKISVNQKLPFPGKRSALRDAATEELISSQGDLESKRLETIADLKKHYFELSFTYASRDILDKQLKLVRSTLEFTRSNFSLSKVPQSDVLTLQVEEALLLDKRVRLEKEIETIRSEINHRLGRSASELWKPKPITNLSKSIPLPEKKKILEQGLLINPTLKSLQAQINVAKAKEEYARLSLYPDFNLMLAYTIHQSNDFDNGGDEVSLGAGITLPLWRANKQDALIQKASADKRKSEFLLSEMKNEIVHEMHSILAGLKESETRLSLATNALLPLTQAAIISAEKAYEVGSVQLTAVLNLIRSRYEAELSYQDAIAQREIKIAELEKFLGGSLELKEK